MTSRGYEFVERARLLSAVFIAIAALLIVRLYFVQIVHGEEYRRSALGQYVENARDTEDRGSIFFTDKDGDLVGGALMQGGWRIAIVPKDVVDPESVYEQLSKAGVDRERFFASLAKT